MARAMTGGELTSIRSDNQWSLLYLAVHMPATVWTGRVNVPPASNDEVATINVDGGAWGSGYSSAIKDMLLYVGTSAGAYDKGFVRVREDLSGTLSSIDVGEISEVDWADDDYLTIVDEFFLAPRHIRIDASQVVYMDYDLTYASQSDPHDDPDPVANLGPSLRPVWLEGGTVDVDFDASDSWTFDGTITGYSWTRFPTAGSSLTGAATATPTFTATQAGTWRLACTVSGSNGKSWTAYRYVKVFDANNMPITAFRLDECAGSWDNGGWIARITLFDEVGLTDIREGSMVALFAKDFYGNTEGSIGPVPDAETILHIGWVANESINWDPEVESVTLELQGPQHWLSLMNGFPSGLEWVAADADAWTDMTTLTLKKAVWQFLHWRTTLTRILDFQVTSDSREFALFNASPGTLWEQLKAESTATVMANPCFDRYARLFIEIEPQVLPTASRASIPIVMTVTTADLRRPVNIERRTIPTTGMIDLSGVVYSAGAGASLFSLSPGHIYKRLGPGVEPVDRLALSSQGQANTLAGHVLGWRNSEYPNLSLPFACNQRMVDVTPHQYVVFSIPAGNIRGLAATLTLVPRSVTFVHDAENGTLQTDVQAESASVEKSSQVGDTPIEPPDPEFPPLPDPDPIPEPDLLPGWPDVCIFPTQKAGVWYATDFTGPDVAGQPTWTQLGTGGAWPGDDELLSFGCDGDDPFSNMYAIATTSRDVIKWNGSTWVTILSAASEYQNSGDALYCGEAAGTADYLWVDRANDNLYVVVVNDVTGSGVLCVYKSGDGGSSWSKKQVYGPAALYLYATGNIMAYNDYIAVGICRGAGAGNWTVYYSTDGGSTYLEADNIGSSDFEQRVFVPENTSEYLRRGWLSSVFEVYSNAWGATSVKKNTDYLWDPLEGDPPLMVWGSAATVGTYRGVFANDLHTTLDSFAAYVNRGQLQIPGYNDGSFPQDVAGMAYSVNAEDEDMIVYFKRETHTNFPQSIFVADGETDVTPEDKSGDDPVTPDGSSIPMSGEGCAFGGPQLFQSGDITLP